MNRQADKRGRFDSVGPPPCSAEFTALLGAYRDSGGTARGQDLASLLKDHHRGDYLSLARRLVAGDLFGFEWRGMLWIPMFQFDERDLTIKPGLPPVLAALSGKRNGWPLARWFTRSHDGLAGRRPVDVFDADAAAVLHAAATEPSIAAV